jgi:hypothetical protein
LQENIHESLVNLNSIINLRMNVCKRILLNNELNLSTNTLSSTITHLTYVESIEVHSFSNSLEGGTWGCEKIWEGVLYFHVLLHFHDPIFQSLSRGFMMYLHLPPFSTTLCGSMDYGSMDLT